MSFTLYTIVFVYVILMFRYLKHIKRELKKTQVSNSNQTQHQNDRNKSSACKVLFKNEISFFTDTFNILFKQRENNARFHIISLLVIYFVGASISLGLSSIQYLYLVKNISIQLSQVNYGYFKALNTLMRAISLLVVLPVLKYYHLPDYWFYLIGITSEFLNLIVFSLASQYNYLIWLGKHSNSLVL